MNCNLCNSSGFVIVRGSTDGHEWKYRCNHDGTIQPFKDSADGQTVIVQAPRPEGDARDGESDRLAAAVWRHIVGLEKTFTEANRPEWAKLCRAALSDLDKLKNYAHAMERGVCVLTSRSPQRRDTNG